LTNVLDAAAEASSELSSLRIVSGLDAPDTMQRLHAETSADFWTGFGQTETSGFVTLQRVRDLPGAAGKAGNLTSVDLVDDDDRPVPVGTAGEIVVRGPLVFLGYDGQKDVTDYTFRNDWHHTGDVGRFDDDGTLYYVKRKPEKELIKPGGENVYPAEVENTIMEMDDVTGVCVFGVPDPKWGEGIKAIVETPAELDAAAVREHVGSRIARFKRPQHVVFTEALPRNEEGAIDREAVKERWP
jgi:long-chain acyl-CoA synthetase